MQKPSYSIINQIIKHPILGEGIVLDERYEGKQFLVFFKDSRAKLWVRSDILEKPDFVRIKSTPKKMGDFTSRKIIEAFRMGIVPKFAIEDFTFSRDSEIKKILDLKSSFEKERGGVLLLEGEYGIGKTHLIDYFSYKFWQQGHPISFVNFDFFDVNPAKPKRIWRQIIETLSFKKHNCEWRLLDVILALKDIQLPKEHVFISKLKELIKKLKEPWEIEILYKWISAESMGREYLNYLKLWRLPVLLDHTPASDIYCYLISGFSWILYQVTKKPWIVFIDEVEILWHLFEWTKKEYGLSFLKGIIKMASNEDICQDFNFKLYPTDLPYGKVDEEGLLHSAIRPTPYLYIKPSNLILFLSSTPSSSYITQHLYEMIKEKIFLDKLKLPKEFFTKLFLIYNKAYQTNISEKIIQKVDKKTIDSQSPRGIIKLTVELMDIWRHYEFS